MRTIYGPILSEIYFFSGLPLGKPINSNRYYLYTRKVNKVKLKNALGYYPHLE